MYSNDLPIITVLDRALREIPYQSLGICAPSESVIDEATLYQIACNHYC